MRDEAVTETAADAGGAQAKGKAKAKAKTKAKAKAAAQAQPGPRKRFSQLNQEEQRERRAYGIMIMLWAGLIGPVLIDVFVLKPYIFKPEIGSMLANLPSLATLIMLPAMIWYVLTIYWK